MKTTQVLIAGAGPTGLMLANQLIRYGIDFILVDKAKGITPLSKALAVHARTLEIYRELGIADAAIEGGQICSQISMTIKGKIIGTVDLQAMGEGKSPYPFMLVLEQSKNEALLQSQLEARSKTVHWQTELVDFSDKGQEVVATLRTADGKQHMVQCDYLVSCEGAKSTIRQKLAIPFAGGTYQSYNFVADLKVAWNLPYHQTYTCLSQDTFAAFFPMPGEQRYRMVGIVPDELIKDESSLTFDQLRDGVLEKLGLEASLTDISWFSVYKAHHRRAEQFSQGRVFLAGDACHVHSPAGGQGMNTGLQDAYNLAWKLSFVLHGWTHAALLDTYHQERSANAEHLLETTDKLFAAESGGGLAGWVRLNLLPYLAPLVLKVNWLQKTVFELLSQTGITYADQALSVEELPHTHKRIHAGDRLPYFTYQDEVGNQVSIYDKLQTPGFRIVLFTAGADTLAAFIAQNEHFASLTNTAQIQLLQINPVYNQAMLKQVFGHTEDFLLLVRPDNYIALQTGDLSTARVMSYLQEKLHVYLPAA